MRIGFDARWYNDSGVGTYVAELLKAMLALPSSDLEFIIYEDPRNRIQGLSDGAARRVPLVAGKYSLAAQMQLRHHCEQDRIDVFHSPFYPIPLRVRCPVVVTLHDLIPFLFRTGNPLKQFVIQRGYKIAAARSSQIIAVSHHTEADITKILRVPAEKITVVHNAVSRETFHSKRDPAEREYLADHYGIHTPYVLAASAHNWQTKNLISALKALSLARSQSKLEFQTVVYGPADGLEAIGGALAWKDLSVIQTGHLPAAGLARLFRNASLFIMPPLYEGFGLPIVEAMSCGCAVITSNGGSLEEVAGKGAQVFDPLDVKGMAQAVIALLCNPAELKHWQERALARANDFSWHKAAQETVSVYHRALGNRLQTETSGVAVDSH